ncbi:YqcC family protein [Vibrio ziniensis]|uniref:YqcC family protein n=1 Tax=Vibrio ziniensis TaxID=2711221 RepID=A0A6G7CGE5_9VIBR|nr:YqcC family protein [Vibrio ziniensis]QIH41143.1 YqcC family protein [Vibrio ziniensis]
MTINTKLAQALERLEAELRQCEVWQATPPSIEAMQSVEPFSIDTLDPHEWLQWVFIPTMQKLLNEGQAIPRGFELSPYFDEAWKHQDEFQAVLLVVNHIDRVCQ